MLNDATACLMSCAWKNTNCRVGVILDSGTNTCYIEVNKNYQNISMLFQDIEKVKLWTGDTDEPKQVIINTEWGAFGDCNELDFVQTK